MKVTFTKTHMIASDFTFSTGGVTGDNTTRQSLDIINLIGKTGAGFTMTATPKAGQGDKASYTHPNVTFNAIGAAIVYGP